MALVRLTERFYTKCLAYFLLTMAALVRIMLYSLDKAELYCHIFFFSSQK